MVRAALVVGCVSSLGCGDAASDTASSGATESASTLDDDASSGPSSASSTATGTTSMTASATGTAGETSVSAGPSTTSTDPTTTEGSTGTEGSADRGEGSETEGDGVVYSARVIIGGLDRVEVRKADYNEDLCVWLRLVWPAGGGAAYPGVTTPTGWAVESISINDVAAACEEDNPTMFGAEAAIDASGTVPFGRLGQLHFPCTLDVDVEAQFSANLPGIPTHVEMTASAIVVDGGC